ncbi:MAG: T9SS type A sorting domain-containing protein [Bacteroidales bacterium]|nr:T9SS type A sorting domain-containing protein [Bacteroidales bacterium]
MKKSFLLALTVMVLSVLQLNAQDYPALEGKGPVSLTPQELFVLSNVPELKLPDAYKGPDAPLLPVFVDNSKEKFFRDITQQSGYECGQSAGIAFNFTYEIDRLRDLEANTPENTYPTHFTWDFLNGGENYTGVSFFDSWEIVRMCGNMNVADYGGTLGYGGFTRWISGYDLYYRGMHNRLTSVKAIRADTPEGLLTLKYWIFDHLHGDPIGGVGNIYGSYFCTPSTTLPPFTPEGGKYVQTYWGSYASHAYTICGYNDAIRYDFNGDGLYTTNIDINGDGVVDLHDCEVGGLKFSNGYAGPGCSNEGFCYTMYKNVADAIEYGGIWNHTIYVLDVKDTCNPQLTMKVKLKHTSRNKLKITAGISTDLNALAPSFVLEFPIFNFQGGDHYMQGGYTEEDKTIEFGLDLTPLMNQIDPGEPIRYFLQVQEKDPDNSSDGEIVNWSLMDYTNTIPVETAYPVSHVAILNNRITQMGLNYTLNFEKPVIANDTLPPALLYQPYDETLTTTGGTPPYHWDLKLDYAESTSAATFPEVSYEQLALTNNNSGYATKTLDFDFPFYNKTVNTLYVYADGYILFDDQPYHYPYQVDNMLLFRQTNIISPFMADLGIIPSAGQGIWYEGNVNYAIIRWKASVNNLQGYPVNIAVKLFPDGTIEFYYGDMNYPDGTTWTAGLSGGDNKNYQFSAYNNVPGIPDNTLDKFLTTGYPAEMSLSEEGHFTGTPKYFYQNVPLKLRATDNNNVATLKTLLFSTSGLSVDPIVTSGGDSLIEFGETAEVALKIINIGAQAFNDIHITILIDDPYITLIDSTEFIPVVNGGEILILPGVFSFNVDPGVPDRHNFQLLMQVTGDGLDFERSISLVAGAPVLSITSLHLADGDNGMLDPGESADIEIAYKNSGSAKASSITVQLNPMDSCLIINPNTGTISLMGPDSTATLTFHVTASPDASFEHLYEMASDLSANNGFSTHDTLFLLSGQIIENFETGDFSKFPWFFSGQFPWSLQTDVVVDGLYAARSGAVTDNAESYMNINVHVLTAGEISFWKYVSCEDDPNNNNYDYLSFKMDGFELARWDGIVPWELVSFPVPAGYHTFSWIYHKDYSVSAGWDGCIVDIISMPLLEGALPELSAGPLSFEENLHPGESVTDTIQVTNLGGGIMPYSVMVFDTTSNSPDNPPNNLYGSSITCSNGQFIPGQVFNWTFNAHNGSADNEGIKHIKMDFPPGINITGATNFSGGSLGELLLLETPGMGNSLNWHGETTSGKGVLKSGETATAAITGSISDNYTDDIFIVYNLSGDSIGIGPHQIPGNVKINNSGLGNEWLTLDQLTGSLAHNQTDTIAFTIDATGLLPKTYQCNLIVRDYYNNKVVVPVTLNVSYHVGTDNSVKPSDTRLTGNYPNPFSQETAIRYQLQEPSSVTITICNLQGNPVRTLVHTNQVTGEHFVIWNGNDDDGNPLAPGIYFCRMMTSDYQGNIKLIRIH